MSQIEATSIALDGRAARIRTSLPADARAIIALRVAMAGETDFLGGEADEIRTQVEEQAQFLERKLASPVDLYILAELEGQIVGIASLDGSTSKRFRHGATLGLAVARAYWGRGLGRALVQALLSWAEAQGVVRVALEVVETNTRAVRLYESLGFEHEGRLRCRRKHGDRYLDNLQMARVRLRAGTPERES